MNPQENYVKHIISLDHDLIWSKEECCFRGPIGLIVGTWYKEPSWREIKEAILIAIPNFLIDDLYKKDFGTFILRRHRFDDSEYTTPFQISYTTIHFMFQ